MIARPSVRLALAAVVWLAAATPVAAANLLTNPGFDHSLAGWLLFFPDNVEWSPADAAGDGASGSARARNDDPMAATAREPLIQCVPVTAGASYEAGLSALVPAGQDREGTVFGIIYFYSQPGCVGVAGSTVLPQISPVGSWASLDHHFTVPPGVVSAGFRVLVFKQQAAGELVAHIDDTFLCPTGTCEEGGGGGGLDAEWFLDPQYPDFRFRALITPAGLPPIEGTHEDECQQDTVCVSGALPGRSEVFVRILGPRPNGYLWPTITRFTPSLVEVEIEQLSSGARRLYTLTAVPADEPNLSGLQDRQGFLP
jgi:hypothetical protein